MDFLQNVMHVYEGHDFFLFLHVASWFFIYKDAMCKDSKHAVLFYCDQES